MTFEDARREVLASLDPNDQRRLAEDPAVEGDPVSPTLKVCCRFSGGACSSPSKRVASKPKKAWVCGSNFSHNQRKECCIAYRRLEAGLAAGISGNRRFPK